MICPNPAGRSLEKALEGGSVGKASPPTPLRLQWLHPGGAIHGKSMGYPAIVRRLGGWQVSSTRRQCDTASGCNRRSLQGATGRWQSQLTAFEALKRMYWNSQLRRCRGHPFGHDDYGSVPTLPARTHWGELVSDEVLCDSAVRSRDEAHQPTSPHRAAGLPSPAPAPLTSGCDLHCSLSLGQVLPSPTPARLAAAGQPGPIPSCVAPAL